MSFVTIQPSTLKFLEELAKNNNREWFNDHKDAYILGYDNICYFVGQLLIEMNKHDHLENESAKKCLYRIYNDVRFSKDKAPFKTRFAAGFRRATKLKRGGYYLNISPGNNYLACGFFNPNADDLKRIRQDIEHNFEEWNAILKSKEIQENFGNLSGNKVLTAPRGFNKEHEAIELIRHKQFILRHNFTDQEVISADFVKIVNETFQSVRPFFDLMSEILTTDENGESNV